MNNKDFEDVIMCFCPHCGDSFEVTNEVLGVNQEMTEDSALYKGASWYATVKNCWKCGKEYKPLHRNMRMTRFVYDAFRTVKMDA